MGSLGRHRLVSTPIQAVHPQGGLYTPKAGEDEDATEDMQGLSLGRDRKGGCERFCCQGSAAEAEALFGCWMQALACSMKLS